MAEGLQAYQKTIDEVKKRIVEQKVPTKFPKGLAILSVLWFEYQHGDPLAGVFFEGVLKSDPEFITDLKTEAGVTSKSGDKLSIMGSIVEKYAETYPIFKALTIVHDDLHGAIKELCR